MNKEQKAAAIEEVAGQIQESEAVFAVDYRGISVPQAADLRTRLTDAGARFRVVKNTLTQRAADQAGADVVGAEDLAERVEEGFTDFDVAIATPDMMPVVGRLGRVLGPQGKMPNPKVGTVTMDIAKAVSESKAGKIEYRTDRHAIVHLPIGKMSFDANVLLENYAALIDEIVRAKPAAAKGRYLHTVTLTTSMNPGIRVDPSRTRDIVEGIGEPAQVA